MLILEKYRTWNIFRVYRVTKDHGRNDIHGNRGANGTERIRIGSTTILRSIRRNSKYVELGPTAYLRVLRGTRRVQVKLKTRGNKLKTRENKLKTGGNRLKTGGNFTKSYLVFLSFQKMNQMYIRGVSFLILSSPSTEKVKSDR